MSHKHVLDIPIPNFRALEPTQLIRHKTQHRSIAVEVYPHPTRRVVPLISRAMPTLAALLRRGLQRREDVDEPSARYKGAFSIVGGLGWAQAKSVSSTCREVCDRSGRRLRAWCCRGRPSCCGIPRRGRHCDQRRHSDRSRWRERMVEDVVVSARGERVSRVAGAAEGSERRVIRAKVVNCIVTVGSRWVLQCRKWQ